MMNKINFRCLFLLTWFAALSTKAQVSSENYILTTERISDTQVLSTTVYYDGLGRPFEMVEQKKTPDGANLIHLQEYDGLGRDWKTWLPVKGTDDFLSISAAHSQGNNQYRDSHAFSLKEYDESPLNRINTVEGVGAEWTSHPVKKDNLVNTSKYPLNCKYYRVSMQGQLQDKGYYPEGRLYVTKTTDENGNESYEFKNIAGNVILKRTICSIDEAADTYYIYDYRGNLAFVLPPNYQEEPSLDLYAYQYKYDGQGNCTWKKLPGCEPIYMKYDLSGRMIFLQDGNLRKQGLWEFYVYDKLGRLAVQGTTASTSDVSKIHVYALYTGAGILDGYQLNGTTITAKSLLITNFYDDYTFIEKQNASEQSILHLNAAQALDAAFPSNSTPNAKGFLTGKKVYTSDGTNRHEISSMYYGLKGRVVQTHSSNLLGGSEHFYTSYNYIGSPLETKHIHSASGKKAIQECYEYAYDHAGRQTMVSYAINGSAKRVLSTTEYDDYGRIAKQTLLGKECINNSYNIRSWKTEISSTNFTQTLAYNKANGFVIPGTAQYNGNISAMSWKTGNNIEKGYKFSYNRQDMLTDADYEEGEFLSDNIGHYDESRSYDKMGNILSLIRYGLRDDNKYGLIDNLSYDYNGNQLTKVDDTVSGPYYAGAFHFVDGTKEATEYSYDANGNMVKDKNKGISSISYDINNLPQKILYNDGRKASYVYDAEENKHSVQYTLTAMTNTLPQMPVMQSADAASANAVNGQKVINYCGNIIYDGDETIVLNDVGYAKYDKGGNLSFHYYLKDHLGDNRVVVNESGAIEQINDYYPTGALMGSSTNGDVQRYKYNGKELDRMNGLDWHDYGARNYDAALGIWRSQDNLQEIHPDIGSYLYVYNNPMRMADPDGQDGRDRTIGRIIGAVTNVIPFTGGLRDTYTPTDPEDYNYSLRQSDETASRLGLSFTNWGGIATVFGSAVAAAGTTAIMVTAGTSATVAAPITVIGKTITKAGLATSTAGYVMMANSNSNKAQGYNRGKKSNVSSGNKNSPHANQKRKEVNRQKYEQLKERTKQLHSKTSKTKEEVAEYNKAKKQLKHLQRIKDNKGENHSRNQKGNR